MCVMDLLSARFIQKQFFMVVCKRNLYMFASILASKNLVEVELPQVDSCNWMRSPMIIASGSISSTVLQLTVLQSDAPGFFLSSLDGLLKETGSG